MQPAQADTTVKVTPVARQGWVGPETLGNPPVTYSFTGPPDADGGPDSFQFGPIAAPNASKIELQPPEVNFPITDFDQLSYDFQVVTPTTGGTVATSAKQFYANVYVDLASNGLGVFSNGFYDCRYSYVPTTGVAGWNTFTVLPGATPTSKGGQALCASTIGANAGNILVFRLNGGDTSASDNGLVGAYDLVNVNTTTYDYTNDADGDGTPDTAPPTNKDQCKNGGWQTFNNPSFRNQGQCVSYTNHN